VSWDVVRFEIRRRANDRETHFFCYADSDHVPLDELTELDTSVVLSGHEIDRVVGRSDLQHDFRIGTSELG